jgi:ATP-dependent helicase HrpA
MTSPDIVNLEKQLSGCMLRDVHRFRRRLRKIRGVKTVDENAVASLNRDISKSVAIVDSRRENIPVVTYPESLPVAQKAEQIKQAILQNQVTILCGETGSGKTTQLPKLCLDIGLGVRGKIGHTQPRRLAARAVAQRIAEELKVQPGNEVGFKVRFSDQSNDDSYIKLMTDGILLAECNHDPFLNQYDVIIIDEAHERSLNIDFLLGYLKRLIQKRKDLKIIITSATIDPERFSRHFDDAPVINVSGRTYPVEVRYRPYQGIDDDNKNDLQQAIIDAVAELSKIDRGDILVFLSGERDIRDTAEALKNLHDSRMMANTEVLPLLARLSNTEQNRIFHPSNKRRIILATNVAETSLTVPGIRYVIDSGVARISRYSWRSKIQRLPIEKISQASANQRKGRCGRVADGVCIRLYDEDDFNLRDEFTEPEIKRTNLAGVILQMENQGLGHIDDFPFVEPPEERLINDGYKLLHELGAIDRDEAGGDKARGDRATGFRITETGRQIARLPIDPKLARMLLQANELGALSEVLIIVAALAVQDPRERPLEKQQATGEKHAAFTDSRSDFLFYVNLWHAFHAEKENLSGNQLRKWCRQNFISWLRMREWLDTHRQIRKMLSQMNPSARAKSGGDRTGQNNSGQNNTGQNKTGRFRFNESAASYEQIHQSLLVGLLANVGLKNEGKEFTGARNKKFNVFPGSALYRKPPQWMMSAEIVETSQVFARSNARIEVEWIERCAGHLLKHHFSDPHWEKKRKQVVATQRSTLYGLLVNPGRKVNYEKLDPVESKQIFIRSALIEGDYDCKAAFFQHNRKLFESLEAQEAKSRRRDIIVDENSLYDFYQQHLPDDICSGVKLERWLRRHPEREQALFLSMDDLIRDDATLISDQLFPDALSMNGSRFPLEYHFDPSHHCDGVTLVTPLAGLNALNPQRCEWLIPGLLQDKVVALIRSLPKALRKNFVPAPDFAEACVQALQPSDNALCTALATQLNKMTGVLVPYDAWNLEQLSSHLLMNFRVLDNEGGVIAEGRDLQAIKDGLSETQNTGDEALSAAAATAALGSAIDQDNVGPEVLSMLDDSVEIEMQGVLIKAYPALVSEGRAINLRAMENSKEAQLKTQQAMRQLVINTIPQVIKNLRNGLPDIQNLCLKYGDFGSCEALKAVLVNRLIDTVFLDKKIRSETEFRHRIDQQRSELLETAEWLCKLLGGILDEYRAIRKRIKNPSLQQLDMVADVQHHLDCLLVKSFVEDIDIEWLKQYPRYLAAINKRLDKADSDRVRDKQLRTGFNRLWDAYSKRAALLQQQHLESAQLKYYRWMLEEYRVSLFAQELKTRFPISEKRLGKYWNEMSDA